MRVKTIVNGKGEPQATEIAIPIEGTGGELWRAMTAREICYSYHSARHKAQQIQILAELNDTDSLEIIKALVRGGERLPDSTVNKLFKRLDKLEMEIREREREYKAIAAALKGEK